jgi:hypothetical protein
MDAERRKAARFSIDPESVAEARAELREIVKGIPVAEAAVEGFSDWQAIEAMERLHAAEPMPSSGTDDNPHLPHAKWLAALLGA